ncbi:hypothetical protein [uncultured Christiangramia sp.]|uniref:hypothetical protein n=1 Tax=uncultured Christiangramia sp. TaxID=503836 RepID=UPI00261600D6|nr:hypothetical protein [uncultured Christiangramia sp.]
MKNTFIILMIGFLFISCSKEDLSDDIIIGKWQPIKMYDAETDIQMHICSPHMFTEYRNDGTFYSGFRSSNIPDECKTIDFALGWTWKNLGNNQYAMKLNQERADIYIVTKQAQNLLIEIPGENIVTVYKRI